MSSELSERFLYWENVPTKQFHFSLFYCNNQNNALSYCGFGIVVYAYLNKADEVDRDLLISGLISLVSAFFTMILTRSKDLEAMIKNEGQRTADERLRCKRGLSRSFFLEALVLVPVSVTMFIFMFRPFVINLGTVKAFRASSFESSIGFDFLVGFVSYGFPFTAVKLVITGRALRILKKFSDPENAKGAAGSE